MNLERVIANRNNKTIYRDGDRCVKVFDEQRTYLLFHLAGDIHEAKTYPDIFCRKSDTAKQYVQKRMPTVAASQWVKGNEKERELLLSWVDVVDYE